MDFPDDFAELSDSDFALSSGTELPAEIPRLFSGAGHLLFSIPMFDEKLPIPELPDGNMFISLLTAFDAIAGATETEKMNITASAKNRLKIKRFCFIIHLPEYHNNRLHHGSVLDALCNNAGKTGVRPSRIRRLQSWLFRSCPGFRA